MDIPTLETDRLILRAPSMDDLDREILFYTGDHAKFVGGAKGPFACAQGILARIGHWHVKGFGAFHLEEKETGLCMGRVGPIEPYGWPEREIGWSLMPDATGKGYATEAALRIRDYVYDDLGWTTVISLIDPENTASARVATRLGARFEKTFEHVEFGTMYIWRHPGPGERP